MTYPFVPARYDYGTRKGPMLAFLVHMAEGGNTVAYLANSPARGVSVHYVVEDTGRIVQMLDEMHASGSVNPLEIRTDEGPAPFGASVAKAVMGSWWQDPNSAVISVEIEGFAKDGPNPSQHDALVRLVDDVRTRYPAMGMLGHRDFTNTKACPGALIDWASLGGHGPAQEAVMFEVEFPDGPILAGTVYVAKGIRIYRIGSGAEVVVGDPIVDRPAVRVKRSNTGTLGWQIDAGSSPVAAHFVYNAHATFTPTPVDCDAAVNAALDEVDAAVKGARP